MTQEQKLRKEWVKWYRRRYNILGTPISAPIKDTADWWLTQRRKEITQLQGKIIEIFQAADDREDRVEVTDILSLLKDKTK